MMPCCSFPNTVIDERDVSCRRGGPPFYREHGSVAGRGAQGRGWGAGDATTRPAAVRERHRPETFGTKWESGAEHRTPKRLPPRGIGSFLTTSDNLFGIGRFGGGLGSGPL